MYDSSRETLVPCPFEKIYVVKGPAVDRGLFLDRLESLERAAQHGSPKDIYEILRELSVYSDSESLQSQG